MLILTCSICSAELPIRIHFLLGYAEYLLVDPSLWRIAVLYMYECGEAGQLRADEVLLRIPLNLGNTKGKEGTAEREHQMDAEDDVLVDGRVRQVLEICKDHGREGVRREICRVRHCVNDETAHLVTSTFRLRREHSPKWESILSPFHTTHLPTIGQEWGG
jgi:Nup85 Nucleoporin